MSKFLTDKKPIRITALNHQEWLENRTGIGSSDIATLMGCNKYSTPYQLWLRLREQRRSEEEETFLMKMGHKLEPIIAELWAEETGNKIIEGTQSEYMYIHPEYDFLRASPDREFKYNDGTAILECKSTQLEVCQEDLPPYWFCQVQYQMGIAQKEYCNIAWLISARKFGFAEVYFNPEFFSYMIDTALSFWNKNVMEGIEPKLESIDDIGLKYTRSQEGCVEADESVIKVYDELSDLRERKKAIEEREKACIEQIKIYMQQNDKLTYAGKTLATWRTGKDKSVFDSERFKKDHPDLYEQYCVSKVGTRPFLIK